MRLLAPPEERTKRLSEELKVPLVIAGGPLSGPPAETIEAVAGTLRGGARGVIVGRNIWQRDRKTGEETVSAIAKLTRNVKFND